jgi:predicted DCC family thiol-disulfide oxidoreductase YuxK
MKLLFPDGTVLGGADATIQIARSIWYAWPFWALAQIPGATPVLRAVYRRIAKNRFCLAGRAAFVAKPAPRHRHLTSSFYELP